MKNYNLNTGLTATTSYLRGQAGRQYIIDLNQDIDSVYSYIYNYIPNYQILNYTDNQGLPYYTLSELKKLAVVDTDSLSYLNVNLALLPGHAGLYNNYSAIAKDQRYYYYDTIENKKPWPEGTILLRNTPKTSTELVSTDILVARLAAAASFYVLDRCVVQPDNTVQGSGKFQQYGEEQYGTFLQETFIPGQPRGWSYSQKYSKENITFIFYPQTGSSSIGTPAYIANFETYVYSKKEQSELSEQYYETILTDETYSDQEFDKDHKPIYTVIIKDGPSFGSLHVG